jgi:hypothetical protein
VIRCVNHDICYVRDNFFDLFRAGENRHGCDETASDLAKLAQKLGNIEVYERVISLQSQAMKLIGANMSLREEMQPLKKELRKLNDKTEIVKSLKHQNNNY